MFHIAFPLMLSALSVQLLLFSDRLILSYYSAHAMSAAAAAGTAFAIFQMGIVSITGIAEVFVGQYNGAQQYHKMAAPIWQMIWFSLATLVVFIPIARMTGTLFVPESFQYEGVTYFKHLVYFTPLHGINTALSAFFIGQGKVRIVTLTVVLGALVNILLDILLIFGIEGFMDAMGTKGSAYATNISQVIVCGVLFARFLRPKARQRYKTHLLQFNPNIFRECFRIGLPNAVGHMIEIGAWAYLFHILSWASPQHAIVLSVGQSIFMLFLFMSDGLSKGVTTIAANHIGARQKKLVRKTLISASIIHFIIIGLIAIPSFLFPEQISRLFLHNISRYDFQTVNATLIENMRWIWIYITFDGLVWVIAGVLTAGGDTRFIMLCNSLIVWIVAILPLYLLAKLAHPSLAVSWKITTLYGIVNFVVFSWRYLSGKWLKVELSA